MPGPTACSQCERDVNYHGLARDLEWDGVPHVFCSFLCEFFWRRAHVARPSGAERALFALPRD
jgi:hypothetical protein